MTKYLCALALLSLAILTAVVAAEEEKEKAKFDASKLVGEWEYVSGERNGEKTPKERLKGKVKITKDAFTVPGEKGKDFVIAYKVDSKTDPASIDLDIKEGPEKGKALGIVTLKDGELKLAYVMVTDKETKRPAKFESTKDNKVFVFALKQAK